MKFHGNYGEVTAEDVVFSLKKAATAATSAFSADYRAFESIEAVDAATVRITLRTNVPSLLGLVTNYSGGYIVSKKAVEERGEAFTRSPIGTGPFALDRVTPNQSAELVAHAGYFRGTPQIGRISYRFIPSDASRDLAFQNRELDLNYGRADQVWVNRTRQLPGVTVDVFEPAELTILNLNTSMPPFNDIRIRRALAHAVNRPEMVRWRGPDVSREGQSLVPRGYLGFTADNGLPQHDPARARALLAEAGFPNGITIKVDPYPAAGDALRHAGAAAAAAPRRHHARPPGGGARDLPPADPAEPLAAGLLRRRPLPHRRHLPDQFFHGRSIVGTPTAVTNFSHCNRPMREIDAARVEHRPRGAEEALGRGAAHPGRRGLRRPDHRDAAGLRPAREPGLRLPAGGQLNLGPLITETTRLN